jgi:glutamyl-tRNA reductase
MSIMNEFFCISAHSKWTDVHDREKLAIPLQLMAPFLRNLHPAQKGTFLYLKTCHRVEIYGSDIDPTLIRNAWCEATGARPESLKIWRDAAALEHFVRVGAGLESSILGENQIMGQIRTSMRESKEANLLLSPVNHILQRGLSVSRSVRSESRIGEGRENLSSLALMRLSDIFETLHDKKFLVVGAGPMALLGIEKLRELNATHITWMNRSKEKIEAHPYSRFCKVEDFSKLEEKTLDSDVIFLATSASHPILSKKSTVLSQISSKKSKLRVVLDLGLPRNADSNIAELGFILRNVDDFKSVLEDQDALQKERIDFAEKMLKQHLATVYEEINLNQLGPIKQEFISKWKYLFEEILLENSSEIGYNQQRSWAKLGHILVTKSNELGPLEGKHFLKQLCESLDALENTSENTSKVQIKAVTNVTQISKEVI